MDVLDMGPEFRAAIQRLRAFAEDRAHWYYPSIAHSVPGDHPAYVLVSGTIRIVFSWTVAEDAPSARVFRHLSVSTFRQGSGRRIHPNTILTFTVASLLGFSGAKLKGDVAVEHNPEWQIELSAPEDPDAYVILVEPVPDAELPPTRGAN